MITLTTKEERKSERARVSKGMGTRDPEKYSTHVSTGFLLRLLDDADAVAAMEKDRDDADELHLDACEKWSAQEGQAIRLRAVIASIVGENKHSAGVIRCARTQRTCGDETWGKDLAKKCKCDCCRAYVTLRRALAKTGEGAHRGPNQ